MLEKLPFSIGFRWVKWSLLFQQLGSMWKQCSITTLSSKFGIWFLWLMFLIPSVDAGGQTSIRPYWRCYFPNTQAIIYVVDSSDTDRLAISKDEFHAILEEEELKGAVVLIFANKQDLPGALDDAAVTEALELHKIKNRQWAIFKTSAIKGEGLFEGLDWLSNTLKSGSG
ncbi:Arf GTPase arf1 [Ancistrocladus abbreviatus]